MRIKDVIYKNEIYEHAAFITVGFISGLICCLYAGSAGGLAAAFNTPIGGIVYAIEELVHDHIKSYKTVLLMSVLIAGFTARLLLGNYIYLGFPMVITTITFKLIFAIIFVGITAEGICCLRELNFLLPIFVSN